MVTPSQVGYKSVSWKYCRQFKLIKKYEKDIQLKIVSFINVFTVVCAMHTFTACNNTLNES